MKNWKGSLVPEEEFHCETMKEAARLVNVIGLLARVYGCPEPRRFLVVLGGSLAKALPAFPKLDPEPRKPAG